MAENVTFYPMYKGGEFSSDYYYRLRFGKSTPRPEDIVIAKTEKCCPRCGALPYWPHVVHFDLGKKSNGKYFGALCYRCGWGF